ncbi:hypothetical protein ACFW95_37970 [Streptomyces sp. NPDC059474]|uniref:hypothetical protein n=1 Tax=Streptomyces sp. NPDC059474 TaxID=3346846 RepID=UPI0036A6ED38
MYQRVQSLLDVAVRAGAGEGGLRRQGDDHHGPHGGSGTDPAPTVPASGRTNLLTCLFAHE